MFKEILLEGNMELYGRYFKKAVFKTIYHPPLHLSAEQKAEEYPLYLYLYEKNEDFVILPSVKRKINDIEIYRNETEEYFDLITPYEYSGVLSNKCEMELFQKFYEELESFCVHNHIIFQFIRFNPYSEEYKAATGFCMRLSDSQNWVDCTGDVLSRFQKRKARYVKSALRNGMICREAEKSSKTIELFYEYYKKAMDRLKAKRFLYFNYEYISCLCRCDFTRVFFVLDGITEQILSGIIVLCDEYHKRIYHHLSFRNEETGNVHSMEYMIYATSQWAAEHGYQFMHLGGGSDSLHRFKDECTDKRIDYYCGSIIYQPNIYQRLADNYCGKYKEEGNSSYLSIYK